LGREVVREYVDSWNSIDVQKSGIQARGAVWQHQRGDAKKDLSARRGYASGSGRNSESNGVAIDFPFGNSPFTTAAKIFKTNVMM
jgi:hypothetical protein